MENSIDFQNPIDNISPKEKEQISLTLGNILSAICFIALIAVPLIFAPFLSDPFDLPKQLLIFILGIGGLLIWSIRNIFQKKPSWTKSAFDLPFLLLAVTALISGILTPNYYSSLSGEMLVIVGGVCLYFLFAAIPQKENIAEKFSLFLTLSASILAAFTTFQVLYTLANSALRLNFNFFLLNTGYNIAGSALACILFLVCILPLSISLLKSKNFRQKYLTIPMIVLIVAGILSSGYILYQSKPILLDHLTGWKIATGVIGQSPKNALLGSGPGNLVDAFTMFKPSNFNLSSYWNLRFSTNSNLYLSVLSTFGIIGLALLGFYIVKLAQIGKARLSLENTTHFEKGLMTTIGLILGLGLIFPTPLLSFFLLFVTSGILMAHYRILGVSLYSKNIESDKKVIPIITALVLTVILLGGSYFLGRFALANYYFARSLEATAKNEGKNTYDYQIKAIELNPWNSDYRITYSQTNLALANSLAGQPNLSEEQKKTVITLVQQSIREARNAAALAPQRAGAWENLSLVYRNLINFAQGANDWSIASQNQAIALDPNNPRLRLDLGGIFFAAKDFQNAAQVFNTAVNLKPDFANAHYNLAQALIGLGENSLALQELQKTSTLICASINGQADCQRVNSEIENLNKIIQSVKTAEQKSTEATNSSEVLGPSKIEQPPLSTPSGRRSNLQKAVNTPAPVVGSSSGELR